jgi:hypothetical protein
LGQNLLDQGPFFGQGRDLTVQAGIAQGVEDLAVNGAGGKLEFLFEIGPVDARRDMAQVSLEANDLTTGGLFVETKPGNEPGRIRGRSQKMVECAVFTGAG